MKGYFPQVLDWFDDLSTVLVCDLLERWPSLSSLQKARPITVNKFFRSPHSVRAATNQRRLAEIKTAVPLTTDGAVLNSSTLLVKVLVAQLRTTIAAIAEYDRHIEALCQTHADYQLFASLPGAGNVYAARLTAAIGTDRSRWTTADELLRFSGVAQPSNAVASSSGSDGDIFARSSSASLFTNTPPNRSDIPSGNESWKGFQPPTSSGAPFGGGPSLILTFTADTLPSAKSMNKTQLRAPNSWGIETVQVW